MGSSRSWARSRRGNFNIGQASRTHLGVVQTQPERAARIPLRIEQSRSRIKSNSSFQNESGRQRGLFKQSHFPNRFGRARGSRRKQSTAHSFRCRRRVARPPPRSPATKWLPPATRANLSGVSLSAPEAAIRCFVACIAGNRRPPPTVRQRKGGIVALARRARPPESV